MEEVWVEDSKSGARKRDRARSQHLTWRYLKLHVKLQEEIICELSYFSLLSPYRQVWQQHRITCRSLPTATESALVFQVVFSIDMSWQDLWRSLESRLWLAGLILSVCFLRPLPPPWKRAWLTCRLHAHLLPPLTFVRAWLPSTSPSTHSRRSEHPPPTPPPAALCAL